MNYVVVVYFVIGALLIVYWFARGKRTFRSREEREGQISTIPIIAKQLSRTESQKNRIPV
jgi:hypothetical protein